MGFQVGAYDPARPLVIDPVLVYSTYLGGSGRDTGRGIAVDASGNAYVTGSTRSTDFPSPGSTPTLKGLIDAFVVKLNAAGTALVYTTFLGGSGIDFGQGIAVDSSGSAYVTGFTNSTDFPTMNPIQPTFGGGSGGTGDAFVAKLNAAGSALVYSTYLGGSGDEIGFGIAVDAAGSAYLTGPTSSTNFPTVNAIQPANGGGYDVFITKLNAAGTALVYSTYLGGSGDELDFGGSPPIGLVDSSSEGGIAVDAAGNAYVVGTTFSTNFPTVNAIQPTNRGISDAFVAKLNAAGTALVYSTYLGGNFFDCGNSLAVDAAGNAYVAGATNSTNFPTVNPLQPTFGGGGFGDIFVAKINAAGTALVYSTYLGGSGDDGGFGLAVDSSGNAYVTGFTNSTDFPTVNAIQPALGGSSDAVVAKLNPSGSALIYSTYLGGRSEELALGIAVDAAGSAYVTGVTFSTNFPTANPVQPAFGGGDDDAFVAKLEDRFDLCLQDDQSHNILLINSATGDYQFIGCGAAAGLSATGRGMVIKEGCLLELKGPHVFATLTRCPLPFGLFPRGSAAIKITVLELVFIDDSNITSHTCACP